MGDLENNKKFCSKSLWSSIVFDKCNLPIMHNFKIRAKEQYKKVSHLFCGGTERDDSLSRSWRKQWIFNIDSLFSVRMCSNPPACSLCFFFLFFPLCATFSVVDLCRFPSAHVLLFYIPRYLNGSHVLQLGGVNENISYEYPQLQHKHYAGCIRNLLVDSKVKQEASWVQCIPMAEWIDCYIVALLFFTCLDDRPHRRWRTLL